MVSCVVDFRRVKDFDTLGQRFITSLSHSVMVNRRSREISRNTFYKVIRSDGFHEVTVRKALLRGVLDRT